MLCYITCLSTRRIAYKACLLQVADEHEVFKAVAGWLDADLSSRKPHLCRLLGNIQITSKSFADAFLAMVSIPLLP